MAEPSLSLDALQVLDAIERRGSFAAAADELQRVPSAISYSVQKLEASLGVTLFQRVGRQSRLTPAGRYLLEQGRQLLEAVDNLADQTREVATGWEPRLRIALDSAYESQPLFDAIAEFRQMHPQIEFDIREEVMSGGWEVLQTDQVDLLVGGAGPVPSHQGLRAELMPAIDMLFAVSPKHPLASLDTPVTSDMLEQESLVVVHDTAQAYIPRSSRFLAARSYCYVQSIQHKICAQMAGVGVGFLPRRQIRHLLESGDLVELPTAIDTEILDNFLVRRVTSRGKALRTFTPLVLKHYERVLG